MGVARGRGVRGSDNVLHASRVQTVDDLQEFDPFVHGITTDGGQSSSIRDLNRALQNLVSPVWRS